MCTYFTLSSFRPDKINKKAADLALQKSFLIVRIIPEELRVFFFFNKMVFYFNDALKFLFSQKEILLTVEENSNPDDNILDKSVLLWSKWDFTMFSFIFSFHISEEWKIGSNESLILFSPHLLYYYSY